MARTSSALTALGALAIASTLAALWLYRDNRRLGDELARARRPVAAAAPAQAPVGPADPWRASPAAPRTTTPAGPPPSLPPAPRESRMDRRSRRSMEIAGLLGRLDGETEDEYRARVLPMMKMALERPRQNVAEMRRLAEDKAGVTAAQRAQLDAAFGDVYDDLIGYTNGAIADGQLSPYTRNVTGMLEYAGGLGAILGGAEQRVDKVLSPAQRRAMYEAGFEWGEYLGVSAPWESLKPPPPPPGGS